VEASWGDKHLEVEDKYLSMLGFVRDPSGKETTQAQKMGLDSAELAVPNKSIPIVVITAVNKGLLFQLDDFLANVQATLPTNPIVVWNIEPETPEEEDDDFSTSLKQSCNSSVCFVKRFNFEDYPEHVKDPSFRAYRPLILQVCIDLSNLYIEIEVYNFIDFFVDNVGCRWGLFPVAGFGQEVCSV
jgi:hypothetical protein